MNQKLLQEIRDLKVQGLSDEEIQKKLASKYQENEIEQCLQALRYINPVSNPAEQINPEAKPRRVRPRRKHYLIISMSVVLFALLIAWPFVLKIVKYLDVQPADSWFQNVYDVDKSYYAGSVSDCSHSNPTRFGEITGESRCYLTVARVYYPRIKQGVLDSVSSNLAELEYRSKEWVAYVNKDGHSIENYTQNWKSTNMSIEKRLNLKQPSQILFLGLQGSSDEKGLGGKWSWSSGSSQLRSNSNGAKLQQQITDTILADKSPAKGAPTATESLQQDKAPLVVFYNFRYCHSPDILGLDNLCLLPN